MDFLQTKIKKGRNKNTKDTDMTTDKEKVQTRNMKLKVQKSRK